MNNPAEINTTNGISHPQRPEGYEFFLSTPTIFALDLIAKNLHLNGIDVLWFYPETADGQGELPMLFVKTDQKERAHSTLVSLDLLDFIIPNVK